MRSSSGSAGRREQGRGRDRWSECLGRGRAEGCCARADRGVGNGIAGEGLGRQWFSPRGGGLRFSGPWVGIGWPGFWFGRAGFGGGVRGAGDEVVVEERA